MPYFPELQESNEKMQAAVKIEKCSIGLTDP